VGERERIPQVALSMYRANVSGSSAGSNSPSSTPRFRSAESLPEIEEDLISLKDETQKDETPLETPETALEEKPETISVETVAESPQESALQKIDIDLEAQAKILEVPTDEYNTLLQDFISDAREMKSEFSDDSSIHSTVSILKDAILLLQLEPLKKILSRIEEAPASERNSLETNSM
jgi:hypothetical protein